MTDIAMGGVSTHIYEEIESLDLDLDLDERDQLIHCLSGGGLPLLRVPRFVSWEEDSL